MRLVRSALLVMTAAMLATGCGDEAGPSASIFGTYTLQTVNGQSLPDGVDSSYPFGVVIGGSFDLSSDNTWSRSLTYSDTVTETETGTFTNNNGSFQFMWEGIDFTGSVSGNTLTIVIPPPPQPAVTSSETVMVFTK